MDLCSAEGLVEIGQQDKCAMLSPAIVLAVAIKTARPSGVNPHHSGHGFGSLHLLPASRIAASRLLKLPPLDG